MIKNNLKIFPASASFPGIPIELSIRKLFSNFPKDSFFSIWSYEFIQICPQHIGQLNHKSAENLALKYPNTTFMPHANVRLFHKLISFDAGSSFEEHKDYLIILKDILGIFNSQHYSFHAPMTRDKSWAEIKDNILKIQDFLQIPVALEGLYPNLKFKNDFWKNSFESYSDILNSNLYFALDLSHINIAYQQADSQLKADFVNLTQEMSLSPYCLEIHISDNDGNKDNHQPIMQNPWWESILEKNNKIVFSESVQN